MPENLGDLIARLDPAQLIGSTFEAGLLRFQLYHPATGRLVSFAVPTDTVHARAVPDDPRRASCSIGLIELGRRLDIRHDRYFPPTDSRLLLADARDRVMLAYGRRRSNCGWLLVLRGDPPLLACLVRDPAAIDWAED